MLSHYAISPAAWGFLFLFNAHALKQLRNHLIGSKQQKQQVGIASLAPI